MVSEEGEIFVTVDNGSDSYIKLTPQTTGKVLIKPSIIPFTKNFFNFTNSIQIYGERG